HRRLPPPLKGGRLLHRRHRALGEVRLRSSIWSPHSADGRDAGQIRMDWLNRGSRPKYTSFLGNPSRADSWTPKFFASSDLGVRPTQSVMLKVPNSEK